MCPGRSATGRSAKQLGGEPATQAVRTDLLRTGDAGSSGEATDERVARGVAQVRGSVGIEEDRAARPVADIDL
jgi:hypothetical protein